MIYEQEIKNAFDSLLDKLDDKTRAEAAHEISTMQLLIDLRTQTLQNFINEIQGHQRQTKIMQDDMDDEGF